MLFQDQISSFFRPPTKGNPDGSSRSVLFVLRRDLCSLYGTEDGPRLREPHGPPMLTTIGMCSGLDLLSWIVMGNADARVPGKSDYERFLVEFGGLTENDAKTVYQFRCAQTHSYGLYTVVRQQPKPKPVGFTLTTLPDIQVLVQPHPGQADHFVVNFWEFKALFMRSIGELHRRLLDHNAADHSRLLDGFYKTSTRIGFISCID